MSDDFRQLRELLVWRDTELKSANKDYDQTKLKLRDIEKEITLTAEALALADACLKSGSTAKDKIESLTTSLLTHVFAEPIFFRFEDVYSNEGELIGYSPVVERRGESMGYAGQGGGVTNLMGFGIRLSCLLLYTELTPVLFLDEPNINLDVDKWERLVEFLEELSEKIDIQILMVSHAAFTFTDVRRFKLPKLK